MPSITERLDLLKETIQRTDFLKGEGLSNEVNIRMFCYESKEEMAVRAFTERLSSENLSCKVEIVDLYEAFLEACKREDILDDIPDMEQEDGKEYLEEQLNNIIDAKVMAEFIIENFDETKDLLMITGVGKAFPFIRVHALLNALQEDFNNKPIVVLYPGTFDGHYVKLFNKLKSNEYYRAFNMIKGDKGYENQRDV